MISKFACAIFSVVCLTSLIACIVGIVLQLQSADQEIDRWYSVTLCPVYNATTQTSIVYYVGMSVSIGGVCGNYTTDNPPPGDTQTFTVDKSLFVQNYYYQPVVYRSQGSQVELQFSLGDTSGALFVRSTVELPPTRRLLSHGVDVVPSHGRRLLKGGHGGGHGGGHAGGHSGGHSGHTGSHGRAHDRGAGEGRFGPGGPIPTPFGRQGNRAVDSGTVVIVNWYGPLGHSARGSYAPAGQFFEDKQGQCSDSFDGCCFLLECNCSRDEFDGTMFKVTDTVDDPEDDVYLLTVSNVTVTTTLMQQPTLSISFFTLQDTPGSQMFDLIIPAASVLVLSPVLLLVVDMCRDSSSCKRKKGYVDLANGEKVLENNEKATAQEINK